MNESTPFQRDDLLELGDFLARAERVVPMRDIAKGDMDVRVIGLRHDVDDNFGSLDTALALARWEFERGISSTYFLLHGAYYWGDDMLVAAEELDELGHEVGIHVNAIAEALRQGRDPHMLLDEALTYLRTAVRVVGCVAHGDGLCHQAGFVNDEIFSESPRPTCGPPTRIIEHANVSVRLQPLPRTTYGLEYDANWLPRGDYVSDSGGRWSQPFESVVDSWPERGQLHMLVHPDWWAHAFVGVPA